MGVYDDCKDLGMKKPFAKAGKKLEILYNKFKTNRSI